MKKKVIIVKNGVCRILINPELKDYIGYEHVVNPDLTNVFGIPPEHWVIEGKKITDLENVSYRKTNTPLAIAAICIPAAIIITLIALLVY